MKALKYEERLACEEVVLGFFRALDCRDDDTVVALMAADGIWNRQGKRLSGRDAIRGALLTRSPDRSTAHIVTNMTIVSTALGQATASYYLTAYECKDANKGKPVATLVAIRSCTDDLVLEDETWKIKHKSSVRQLPPE